jgi:hypothetical protein
MRFQLTLSDDGSYFVQIPDYDGEELPVTVEAVSLDELNLERNKRELYEIDALLEANGDKHPEEPTIAAIMRLQQACEDAHRRFKDRGAEVDRLEETIAKQKRTWQALMAMVYGKEIPTEHCNIAGFARTNGEGCLGDEKCFCTCVGCCYAKALTHNSLDTR